MEYQEYKEYREYFKDLIDKKEIKELKESVSELKNVVDIAEIIEDMEDKDMLLVFRMLPKEKSAEVFSYMELNDQLRIVTSITEPELNSIIEELNFDDRIDILEEMPANVVTKVLKNTPASERKLINEFLRYPEDSAGSIMTIEYVNFTEDMTVKEAMEHIKEVGMDKETIYTCYVENEYKMLIGFVSLRTIVISDEDKKIKDIMIEDVVSVNTLDDREEVADAFIKYGYIALPVVDGEHRLCGIITFDDIMDVVEAETTEDFHKMAAINPSEDEYLDQTPWQLSKNRIPWLLILMISATFTGGIINRYNYILVEYMILNTFIPMMTDTGGNSGSQSSTTVIRALATGEIGLSDSVKVMLKEVEVGLICGSILSFVNFLRLIFIAKTPVVIAILVSFTMLITVVLSKFLGATLPMLVKRVNLDPAIMASALITTIIDSVVLLIYFGLASKFLPL
ncbi:magnesium transporter [Anaerosphaera aminiphila DSM 21120]|uniref:Magnesium transporter MgtE n=1 Tax=Anaerosphaera aminiphila DSM 21120 TaxID=1120995 RepID=A0A1M5R6D8_9FIRM|nr:magnesium transporter [Anaerosphaera aminiphila]SHH21955.1 magnesium transporter [Anaerosphaera aminiphila DSM 21120]